MSSHLQLFEFFNKICFPFDFLHLIELQCFPLSLLRFQFFNRIQFLKKFKQNHLKNRKCISKITFFIFLIFLSLSGSPVKVTFTLLTTDGPFFAGESGESPSSCFLAFLASRFFFCFKAVFDGCAAAPGLCAGSSSSCRLKFIVLFLAEGGLRSSKPI